VEKRGQMRKAHFDRLVKNTGICYLLFTIYHLLFTVTENMVKKRTKDNKGY